MKTYLDESRNVSNKIHHLFTITKTVSQLGIQRDFLVLVNSTYSKSHSKKRNKTYSKYYKETAEAFLPKLETRLNAHNNL